jgi:regulator of cell morphogenesis and NO signaling
MRKVRIPASCRLLLLALIKFYIMTTLDSLFVPALEPAKKHPAVFEKFDALPHGEAFLLINDHDPKPLYYQMVAERGKVFNWQYLEEGPEVWQVKIEKHLPATGETIGQMVAKDIRKADVFKKWGIDFCCGGKKTLQQVCAEKGLDEAQLSAELQQLATPTAGTHQFLRWQPDFLVDYIYNQHHLYYYEEEPIITELLQKVTERHGDHFPELQKLSSLYELLVSELNTHFKREEKVLFPFIKALVQASATGNYELLKNQPSLILPVQMMEADHDAAGEILEKMNGATNGYTPPANACNSFRFLYHKLSALENDLHQHVHLENNILFPKALELERNFAAGAV